MDRWTLKQVQGDDAGQGVIIRSWGRPGYWEAFDKKEIKVN